MVYGTTKPFIRLFVKYVKVPGLTREEELTLIRRFQSGDTSSFDTLVEMFREKGYSLAYQWTNNQEDALDILQEAFIKMYKIVPKWKPKSSLFTWLYRVIINQAIDLQRKKGKIRFLSTQFFSEDGKDGMNLPASELVRPDRQTTARELNDGIYQAVMKLPRRQKEVFTLKHYHGLSLKEIAEVCKCSTGAVKANLFQAVRKLRKELVKFKEYQVVDNG